MTTKPLFSIITITLNNLDGLRATQSSIESQTFTDYEWIVIDGSSNDGTPDYLATTIATWVSEKDNGLYDAMNKGIDRAHGDYLLFLNAGDALADKDVLGLIANKTKQQPDFMYGDALEDVNGTHHLKKSRPHPKITNGMITHHQSMLYRRAALGGRHYNTTYKISADYDLTLQFLKNNAHACYIPVPLCLFQAGGLSQQKVWQGRCEQFTIRRAQGVFLLKNLLIFLGQSVLYTMRRALPSWYWQLKRH